MDDAMDMSLDDYINSFKQSKNEHKPNSSINRIEESKFKEGRREQNDDDFDDVLDLQGLEDDYVSLTLDSNNSTIEEETESNDLRNKIVGRFPQSSQQWRLMQPNIMNVRPAGMPPLVPSDAPQNCLNGNRRGNWRNYNHNNNHNYRHRRNNWSNNYNNNNNNYYNNRNNNYNNGRIQRFNNNSRVNLNSKNIQMVLEQLKQRNPMILYSASDISNLAQTSNPPSGDNFAHLDVPTILKSKVQAQSVVTEPIESPQFKGSEAIKSLLGVSETGIRNDMMPALAGKLLDLLNGTNTTHKTIYDMNVQTKIHEIQKKPLLYKCPGGEVVSSDGVGISNCKIQPKVSGVSLNNRFA